MKKGKWIVLSFVLTAALSAFATDNLTAGEIVILGDQFKFTEGPAVDAKDVLYFTDIPANLIYQYTPDKKLSVYRENTGGANGLFFDKEGTLYVCEGDNGKVTATTADGKTTTLAEEYNGVRFNKPNDLWIDPHGGIYFTDPLYGNLERSQDGEHVYYISADRKKVSRVIDDMVRPNGIIGTPDGKILYVADHGGGKVWKYDINPDHTLTNKTHFADGSSDGMTLDTDGNVYTTEPFVHIFNPAGKQIGVIETPERPTNVAFGGKNNQTLYITARKHVCSIEMKTTGAY